MRCRLINCVYGGRPRTIMLTGSVVTRINELASTTAGANARRRTIIGHLAVISRPAAALITPALRRFNIIAATCADDLMTSRAHDWPKR